ncbi:uncharacterized protein LOC144146594 [Haemaphysalis longicornis]
MASNNKIRIWHWNSNGFRCRKAVLQQHIRSLEPAKRPDIIAIQETHLEETPKLSGYRAHDCPPSARTCGKGAAQGVCTLIRKGLAHVKHQQFQGNSSTALEMCVTELAFIGKGGRSRGRRQKTSTSLLLANIYSNPRHSGQKFKTLFNKVKHATTKAKREMAKMGDAAAIVCGDFNAQHLELGYTVTTAKGKDLLEDAAEAGFTLLTNPAQPSRIGTSTARDTNPDLAFALLPSGGTARWRNTGINLGSDHFIIEIEIPLAHTNGDQSRDNLKRHRLVNWDEFRKSELGEIADIDEWSARLKEATNKATKEVEATGDIETMDSRLAHLLDARRSLQRRWRRQRHNRKLRKKIAELGREIERYSKQLCAQQWFALCNQVDGQLHRSGPWKILRQLMDETKSHEFQHTRMAQILHTTARQMGEEEMHKRLNDRYLPETSREDHRDYEGRPNSHLDRDIEEWEVRLATQNLNCRSAAGPDKISNKTLRNLNDSAIAALTKYYNECWRSGTLPKHVLNTRWNDYLERHGIYPDSMLGFRARLATQDAMLLIQREILDPPGGLPGKDNRVSRLGLGARSYNYVRAFLSDRTARLEVGGKKLEERKLGSVARRLETLNPGVRHCLYADDVTIWVTGGSNGEIESNLQAAVDALLILPPPGRHRKAASQEAARSIVVRTSDGAPIPHVPGLRILGMFVDGVQTNTTALKNIVTKIGIATRLVKRVSTRHRGMNERGLLRLLQAFVVSQATYAGAFHRWTKAEEGKIDAAIRKAYKTALGLLPRESSTARGSSHRETEQAATEC